MATYDRKASERALVEAVGELIARDGFGSVGVNAVARESGVNKSLIYRYFGGMDGLYQAYAESHSIWPPLDELLGDVPTRIRESDWREAFVELMMLYAHAIRSRPRTIELLAWECNARNGLIIAFEEVRERRSNEIFGALVGAGFRPPVDLRATIAFIASAIHYLLIRGRTIRIFSGAQIQSDDFWEREIRAQVEAIVRGLAPES